MWPELEPVLEAMSFQRVLLFRFLVLAANKLQGVGGDS